MDGVKRTTNKRGEVIMKSWKLKSFAVNPVEESRYSKECAAAGRRGAAIDLRAPHTSHPFAEHKNFPKPSN